MYKLYNIQLIALFLYTYIPSAPPAPVMVWYGMVWYGMAWYGVVWYGIV